MKQLEEIWKDIQGYEGLYQISSHGRVKSLPKEWISANGAKNSHSGKILKPSISRCGYLRVGLRKNNKTQSFIVHRIVAKSFIPNYENKPEVNHKDGIKTNNFLNNLEWNTSSENTNHAISSGLRKILKGSFCGSSILTEYDVKLIRKLYRNSKYWKHQRRLADLFNTHFGNINLIVNNKSWKHVI